MLGVIGQVAAGFVVSNFVEWTAHKLVLHDLGKRRNTWFGRTFGYHWRHHRIARTTDMRDHDYDLPWHAEDRLKEILGIGALAVGPCLLISKTPIFTATTIAYAGFYLWAHRKAHVDVEWGKKWLSHHVSHHMGNQNSNFGILSPLADIVLGTYKPHSEDDLVKPKLRIVS